MSASGSDPNVITGFYKPYMSDESGSESDTDSYTSRGSTGSTSSTGSTGSTGSTAATATAATAGPEKATLPSTQTRTNLFSSGGADVSEVTGDYKKIPLIPAGAPTVFNQTNPAFTSTKLSSSVMINSSNRDTKIFPQPSSFSIRLPRVYRNVASISVTQIKMLSSFYYFSDTKNNTSVRVQEYGRTKKVNDVDVPNPIDVFIRNGTYDVNSLVSELNNNLNYSPTFKSISRVDFARQFSNTGDYTLLFNPPGNTTFNIITGVFETLQSTADIVAKYFSTAGSLGVSYYKPDEVLVAYYYPMLKDLTVLRVSTNTLPPVNPFVPVITSVVYNNKKTYGALDYAENDPTNVGLLEGSSSYDRIVYGFQGLNDPYILSVIQNEANRAILDQYKSDNTWNNYLVNNYICSYDSNGGRLSIYSRQLNTSIVTDLNTQYAAILTKELVNSGINPGQVQSIQTNATNLNASSIDMYNFLQQQFSNFFGVNYGTYSSSFYANFSNQLNIYDASGRYGWDLTYQGGTLYSSTDAPTYEDLSGYWPGLNTLQGLIGVGSEVNEYYCLNKLKPTEYIRYTYTKQPLADSKGFLMLSGGAESGLGYQDISIKIPPTTYFKTSFKSRCRQTVYLAMTPPNNADLSEEYFLDNDNTPLLYASNGDYLIDTTTNNLTFFDISQNLLDGPDYMRTFDSGNQVYLQFIRQIKPAFQNNLKPGSISLYSYNPILFFRIIHGGYRVPLALTGKNTKFKSDIYIEREDGAPFGVNLDVYWYRDRAAFMADASYFVKRNSTKGNPKHYFSYYKLTADQKETVITEDFVSFEESFFFIRAQTPPTQVPLRVFSILYGDYGVHTPITDADLRRLPVDRNYLNTKTKPSTSFPSDFPLLFNSKKFRNSYDLSGVSDNLLAYVVLNQDNSHFDPYNFVNNVRTTETPLKYLFQLNSPATLPTSGIDTWSQFFYKGSRNVILDITNDTTYYDPGKASSEIATGAYPFNNINNEYVFANWFKAGSSINLFSYYNSAGVLSTEVVSPETYPEHTIMPYTPANLFEDFSYGQDTSSGISPFPICFKAGSFPLATDISFNQLNFPNPNQLYLDASGCTSIIGIPFLPPSTDSVIPQNVVIKFSYIQPCRNTDIILGRGTPLQTTNADNYNYTSYATKVSYTGSESVPADMLAWDDKYLANRKNTVLGVFFVRDIIGKKTVPDVVDLSNNVFSNIDIGKALCTLTLKKIVQTSNYVTTSGGQSSSKLRAPEWGTYYIYEKSTLPTNVWVPVNQTVTSSDNKSSCKTQWAAIKQPADISQPIQMKDVSAEMATFEYFSDVSNNALCFIPFYADINTSELASTQDTNNRVAPFNKPYSQWLPGYTSNTIQYLNKGLPDEVNVVIPRFNPSSGFWKVGSFTGLTYTNRPYLPFSSCATHRMNPNIYYPGASDNIESICVEDIGGRGLATGLISTYLGACGPICLGSNSRNVVYIPNGASAPTFFNIRVNLIINQTAFNPIKEIANSPNLSSCLANTLLFAYDADATVPGLGTKDVVDIVNGWGSESKSNWLAYDDDSGYNNLSYLNSFPVKKGQRISLNVRSYLPTTSLNCGLRIVAKNWCDFGFLSLQDLMNEIDSLLGTTTRPNVRLNPDGTLNDPDNFRVKNNFTYNYARTLLEFNAMFIGSFTFGLGFSNASYPGLVITSVGFTDYMNQFKELISTVNTAINGITAAQANALAATKAYIKENYSGVLPDSVIKRNRYTDPLAFSILFKSALRPPYDASFDQWGLGWTLGFDKVDTTFATRCVASTFIRIIDDFIYLKLNDEFNCNSIDSSGKEDLSKTRETSGTTRGYFGKLLLNAFGSFAQTFVQSTKPLPAAIGKIDQLRFSFFDANNNQIFNNDCEFNVSLEISEIVDAFDINTSIVRGMGGVAPTK